jgi:FkbM family methyltransferase
VAVSRPDGVSTNNVELTVDPRDSVFELLREPVEAARERERSAFSVQLRETDGSIVIFGAGRLGQLCAAAAKSLGVDVVAFCDNEARYWGTRTRGVPVISPGEASAKFGHRCLFVIAIWTGSGHGSIYDRLGELRRLGCAFVVTHSALLWAGAGEALPFHRFHLPSRLLSHADSLRRVADSLCDEKSVYTLEVELWRRLHGRYPLRWADPEQYIAPDIIKYHKNEVVVDAGAYTGDTLKLIVDGFRGKVLEYHAFEPNPSSLLKLTAEVAKLSNSLQKRVFIHPFALSNRDGYNNFLLDEESSRTDIAGSTKIVTHRLDSIKAVRGVTFVKVDVEGAELDFLRGARAILRRYAPTVAVCMYHRFSDLWSIPALLSRALPNHRYFLREHGRDGWESVFYAVRQS